MKNWIDPDDEIVRGKRKKPEQKPRAKKSDHKHTYIDGVCSKCNKEKQC